MSVRKWGGCWKRGRGAMKIKKKNRGGGGKGDSFATIESSQSRYTPRDD